MPNHLVIQSCRLKSQRALALGGRCVVVTYIYRTLSPLLPLQPSSPPDSKNYDYLLSCLFISYSSSPLHFCFLLILLNVLASLSSLHDTNNLTVPTPTSKRATTPYEESPPLLTHQDTSLQGRYPHTTPTGLLPCVRTTQPT